MVNGEHLDIGGPDAKVYSFDPNSSPQEKGAAAAKGSERVKPVAGAANGFQAKGVFNGVCGLC